MGKTVSIITPSLNQGQFIEKTINSIWSQKGNFNLEHIIVDGGSTDNTIFIIKKYNQLLKKKKWPIKCQSLKLIWWSRPDKGQSEALNQGFSKSTGEIITWLNSDDIYANQLAIQKTLKVFQEHPSIKIVTGNSRAIDQDGKPVSFIFQANKIPAGKIKDDQLKKIRNLPIISQPATFFRQEVLDKCHLDNNLDYTMDWDLWIQAYKKGLNFYKLNHFIAKVRIHAKAKTTKNKKKMHREWLKLYHKHGIWNLERLTLYKNLLIGSL